MKEAHTQALLYCMLLFRVNKGASVSSTATGQEQHTLPVRRVIYLALRDNITSLHSDLKLMNELISTGVSQGLSVSPGCDVDETFSFSKLKVSSTM